MRERRGVRGGQHGGDPAGTVERWRDLDTVPADHVGAGEAADEFLRLGSGQAGSEIE